VVVSVWIRRREVLDMAVTRRHRRARVPRKNYRIDTAKLDRTQRILGTRTEAATIHRALDLAAEEAALVKALRNFVLKGGGHIEDLNPSRSSGSAGGRTWASES
jgi:hypothetical protein